MNRHDRRAAKARARRMHWYNRFYLDHIHHLPRIPLDAPYERGRVYHLCMHHDEWCRFYDQGRVADCSYNPTFSRHIEPVRS